MLADLLYREPARDPETEAQAFLKPAFTTDAGDNPGVADVKAALEGARHDPDGALLPKTPTCWAGIREVLQSRGVVVSKVADGKQEAGAKFADYFDYQEPLKDIPSHRALALLRGRREEVLAIGLKMPEDLAQTDSAARTEGSVSKAGAASKAQAVPQATASR